MLQIGCPNGGDFVKVIPPTAAVTAACPQAVGTICVWGTLTEGFPGLTAAQALADPIGQFIRVRVVMGSLPLGQAGSPSPKLACDVDAVPVGQFWCAQPVPVPDSSAGGAPLTVFAWLLFGGASGGAPPLPVSQLFTAGPSGPIDCCSGCGSGSGGQGAVLAGELASSPALQVTVPDGKNAGAYQATAVASMKWRVAVGGTLYALAYCNVAGWTIKGPSASAPSTSFDCDPFSATFPGAILEAVDEIVVTVA